MTRSAPEASKPVLAIVRRGGREGPNVADLPDGGESTGGGEDTTGVPTRVRAAVSCRGPDFAMIVLAQQVSLAFDDPLFV